MLKIYQPVSPYIFNQEFGANQACISKDGKNKVIYCDGKKPPVGYRSVYGSKGHLGIDLKATHGQEVHCALGGYIKEIDTEPRTGLDVKIESSVNGKKYRHIYEHLLGYQGKVGDFVMIGQLVGWADNTGYSSGDHLHFELQEWNGKKWVSIDPTPFMQPVFARDYLRTADGLKWVGELLAKIADNLAYRLRQAGK